MRLIKPAHWKSGWQTTRRTRLSTSPHGVAIIISGPLVADDGTSMIGSLMILEAPDRATVEAFNRADPFDAAGIWEKVDINAFVKRQG
jgi:uncharacterized protein YciI